MNKTAHRVIFDTLKRNALCGGILDGRLNKSDDRLSLIAGQKYFIQFKQVCNYPVKVKIISNYITKTIFDKVEQDGFKTLTLPIRQ